MDSKLNPEIHWKIHQRSNPIFGAFWVPRACETCFGMGTERAKKEWTCQEGFAKGEARIARTWKIVGAWLGPTHRPFQGIVGAWLGPTHRPFQGIVGAWLGPPTDRFWIDFSIISGPKQRCSADQLTGLQRISVPTIGLTQSILESFCKRFWSHFGSHFEVILVPGGPRGDSGGPRRNQGDQDGVIFRHFGTLWLRKCASRVGETQILKKRCKKWVDFYSIAKQQKSCSRVGESSIFTFWSMQNIDFFEKSKISFWAWHVGESSIFMFFLCKLKKSQKIQ